MTQTETRKEEEEVPSLHTIEKEDEVVFYIPYEKELTNVYTSDFFALHSQDAEVAIIAFHDSEYASQGGALMDLVSPYRLFSNKAKYVEDKLKGTFNEAPSSESSFRLFSSLINNTKRSFQNEVPLAKQLFSDAPSSDKNTSTTSTTLLEQDTNTSLAQDTNTSLAQDTTQSLDKGYIFQITIQKRHNGSASIETTKPHLRIPVDVVLEKEIDYFREKMPLRPIRHKYYKHGIYMVA
jgi:hypothetical protein